MLNAGGTIYKVYDTGASYTTYINPLTSKFFSLETDSDGLSTFTYVDSGGEVQAVEYSDFLSLDSNIQDIIEDFHAQVGDSLSGALSSHISDGGADAVIESGSATIEVINEIKTTYPSLQTVATNIDGQSYFFTDIASSILESATAISTFITAQVGDSIKWLTGEQNGAQLIFAEFLGENIEDLISGDLSPSEAFIDLAEAFAERTGAHQLGTFINAFGGDTDRAAKGLFATVLVDDFHLDPADATQLSAVFSEALARFAIDFAQQLGDLDAEELAKAGLLTITALTAQTYATKNFSGNAVAVSATVAAATAAISTLLDDFDFEAGDFLQLGVNAGIAAATAGAGVALTPVFTSVLGALGGPAAGFVAGFIVSKVAGGIYKGKVYKDGEFESKAQALSSIYAVQDVDDGNGHMVKALVATNAQGSAVLLKKGILYALGGAGADTLVGDGGGIPADNVISGGGDADYIEGRAGDDALFGDAGNDHIIGGQGADLITGGAGSDELFGDEGDDTILGEAGDEFIHAGRGNDVISGGSGNDIILASAGDDVVDGDDGRDLIELGAGDDLSEGGAGDDVILGNIGNDNLVGGDGADSLFGEDDNDQLTGGAGGDYLDGGAGVDILMGEAGADKLDGGIDDDALDGGIGPVRAQRAHIKFISSSTMSMSRRYFGAAA